MEGQGTAVYRKFTIDKCNCIMISDIVVGDISLLQ